MSRIELLGGKPTAMARLFRRGLLSKVGLNVGAPLEAEAVQLEELKAKIAELLTA